MTTTVIPVATTPASPTSENPAVNTSSAAQGTSSTSTSPPTATAVNVVPPGIIASTGPFSPIAGLVSFCCIDTTNKILLGTQIIPGPIYGFFSPSSGNQSTITTSSQGTTSTYQLSPWQFFGITATQNGGKINNVYNGFTTNLTTVSISPGSILTVYGIDISGIIFIQQVNVTVTTVSIVLPVGTVFGQVIGNSQGNIASIGSANFTVQYLKISNVTDPSGATILPYGVIQTVNGPTWQPTVSSGYSLFWNETGVTNGILILGARSTADNFTSTPTNITIPAGSALGVIPNQGYGHIVASQAGSHKNTTLYIPPGCLFGVAAVKGNGVVTYIQNNFYTTNSTTAIFPAGSVFGLIRITVGAAIYSFESNFTLNGVSSVTFPTGSIAGVIQVASSGWQITGIGSANFSTTYFKSNNIFAQTSFSILGGILNLNQNSSSNPGSIANVAASLLSPPSYVVGYINMGDKQVVDVNGMSANATTDITIPAGNIFGVIPSNISAIVTIVQNGISSQIVVPDGAILGIITPNTGYATKIANGYFTTNRTIITLPAQTKLIIYLITETKTLNYQQLASVASSSIQVIVPPLSTVGFFQITNSTVLRGIGGAKLTTQFLTSSRNLNGSYYPYTLYGVLEIQLTNLTTQKVITSNAYIDQDRLYVISILQVRGPALTATLNPTITKSLSINNGTALGIIPYEGRGLIAAVSQGSFNTTFDVAPGHIFRITPSSNGGNISDITNNYFTSNTSVLLVPAGTLLELFKLGVNSKLYRITSLLVNSTTIITVPLKSAIGVLPVRGTNLTTFGNTNYNTLGLTGIYTQSTAGANPSYFGILDFGFAPDPYTAPTVSQTTSQPAVLTTARPLVTTTTSPTTQSVAIRPPVSSSPASSSPVSNSPASSSPVSSSPAASSPASSSPASTTSLPTPPAGPPPLLGFPSIVITEIEVSSVTLTDIIHIEDSAVLNSKYTAPKTTITIPTNSLSVIISPEGLGEIILSQEEASEIDATTLQISSGSMFSIQTDHAAGVATNIANNYLTTNQTQFIFPAGATFGIASVTANGTFVVIKSITTNGNTIITVPQWSTFGQVTQSRDGRVTNIGPALFTTQYLMLNVTATDIEQYAFLRFFGVLQFSSHFNQATSVVTSPTAMSSFPQTISGILQIGGGYVSGADTAAFSSVSNISVPSVCSIGIIPFLGQGGVTVDDGEVSTPFQILPGQLFIILVDNGNGQISNVGNGIFTTNSTNIKFSVGTTYGVASIGFDGDILDTSNLVTASSTVTMSAPQGSTVGLIKMRNPNSDPVIIKSIGGASFVTMSVQVSGSYTNSSVLGVLDIENALSGSTTSEPMTAGSELVDVVIPGPTLAPPQVFLPSPLKPSESFGSGFPSLTVASSSPLPPSVPNPTSSSPLPPSVPNPTPSVELFIIDCGDGLHRYPYDCSLFYQCYGEKEDRTIFVFSCVQGLIFDELSQQCVHPSASTCDIVPLSSHPASFGGGFQINCGTENVYSYPIDCNSFYQCLHEDGKESIYVYSCNAGLVFDEDSAQCKLPIQTVPCNSNEFIIKSPSFGAGEKINVNFYLRAYPKSTIQIPSSNVEPNMVVKLAQPENILSSYEIGEMKMEDSIEYAPLYPQFYQYRKIDSEIYGDRVISDIKNRFGKDLKRN